MVPTQFGQVPDVALEELKQLRQQQTQMPPAPPAPLSFSVPSFSPLTNSNSNSNDSNAFVARSTARDLSLNGSNPPGTVRSRSLAPNPPVRPSVLAASTNVSNPSYQTPIFAMNKQTSLNPTRFDIRRLNPLTASPPAPEPVPPPAPASSSMSLASSRSVPNSKAFPAPPLAPPAPLISRSSNAPAPAGSASPRSQYETTYRASFIKPIVP